MKLQATLGGGEVETISPGEITDIITGHDLM